MLLNSIQKASMSFKPLRPRGIFVPPLRAFPFFTDITPSLNTPVAIEKIITYETPKTLEAPPLTSHETVKEQSFEALKLVGFFFQYVIIVLSGFFLLQLIMSRSGRNNPMQFAESTATECNETGIKFDDVAGLKSAKEDLEEIVEFLKNPEKFSKLGAKIPKGVLLNGPAGVGKTLLGKALSGEAGVPFYYVSAAEFVQMFVGIGASRIRSLFEKAKKKAPSIIFIDELDAVAKARGTSMNASNDEREQAINQLLTEMDGFKDNTGIVVIAATNRVDVLDPAILRPGRFDRIINVNLPDYKERVDILKVHTKNKPLDNDFSIENLAKLTTGFSGADLANLANEAAILAARQNKDTIHEKDFTNALEKIALGAKRDIVVSEEKKKIVAYHEAGHALVALKIGEYDAVRTVSIIPRGKTGGTTWFQPDDNRLDSGLVSREYLENQIAVALGGRIGEEIVFGHSKTTTGASGDIVMVQNIARHMVTYYGMNPRLGPIAWMAQNKFDNMYAESTLAEIDNEIKALVNKIYDKTRNIIIQNRSALDAIAEALLEKEVISGDELRSLVGNV